MSELWTWLEEMLAVPEVQALAVVLGGLLLARVVDFVITRGLARLVRRTETELDDRLSAGGGVRQEGSHRR